MFRLGCQSQKISGPAVWILAYNRPGGQRGLGGAKMRASGAICDRAAIREVSSQKKSPSDKGNSANRERVER